MFPQVGTRDKTAEDLQALDVGESDEGKLRARQKQLDIGKNTQVCNMFCSVPAHKLVLHATNLSSVRCLRFFFFCARALSLSLSLSLFCSRSRSPSLFLHLQGYKKLMEQNLRGRQLQEIIKLPYITEEGVLELTLKCSKKRYDGYLRCVYVYIYYIHARTYICKYILCIFVFVYTCVRVDLHYVFLYVRPRVC